MKEIWDTASRSYECVRDIDNLEEAHILRRMMVETMGYNFTEDGVDCIITTMCTNRNLTDVLNDYRRDEVEANDERYNAQYGWDRFRRLFDDIPCWVMFTLVHNDALYSRSGMGPLWGDILDQIDLSVAAKATGGTTTTNTIT